MKILAHAFTMMPTSDFARTVATYIDNGLEVLWRPDPQTALVGIDDRACVMVEDDPIERGLGPGPVLLVDNLTGDLGDHMPWSIAPLNVPAGRYAAISTGDVALRYLELSKIEGAVPRIWFGDSPIGRKVEAASTIPPDATDSSQFS